MKRTCIVLASLSFLTACGSSSATAPPLPPPQQSQKLTHIVVLLQENRSFNTLFMDFPGADTAESGPCKPLKWAHWCKGVPVKLTQVTLESSGVPGRGDDIGHEHSDFQLECDRDATGTCAMDGFDLIRSNVNGSGTFAKNYPYSFVKRSEIAAYWDFAKRYALADHMFFSDTAASFIAHQEIIAGTVRLNDQESLTDQPDGPIWGCDGVPNTQTPILRRDGREFKPSGSSHLPFPCFTEYSTMADVLDAKSVSWKYYVNSLNGSNPDPSAFTWNGFDAIKHVRYGHDWKNVTSPNTKIFGDIAHGTLPSVSWLIPQLGDSDHPASGCNGGPWWVTKVVNAIGASPYWKNTAIVILWDDWGGWYDNVPPRHLNYTSLGFRVPMIVISPYAKPGYVSHKEYQFGSVLKLMEQTFGLGSLGTTDATSQSMTDVFDFTQTPAAYAREPLPSVRECGKTDVPIGPSMREVIEHDGGEPD